MHIIENKFLKVTAREFGAELTSVINKKTGVEHVWQADPAFWGWHAPVLFPVVGRCLDDTITVDGNAYRMEKHGFARKSTFKLLELSENRMVFSLMWSEETLAIYPYRFEFLIGYDIADNALNCRYEVRNVDDKKIWFSLGGHPAFKVPFFENEEYSDYSLVFSENENSQRHLINSEGFFDARREDVFETPNQINLTSTLFNEDALIFKDLKSREVSIANTHHAHKLIFKFSDFNCFGIWAKPGASYVCLEPWLGCADTANRTTDFSNKEAIVSLNPTQEFVATWSVTTI